MPTWLAVALLVLLALIVALAVGGIVEAARRRRGTRRAFESSLDEADRALAAAHAEDKGWEPAALRTTATRLFEAERPGVDVLEQALIQVVDAPGTDADKAIFRFVTATGEELLTLGRRGGEWVQESIEPSPAQS